MALLCVCFGLRISEALALKWGDVDWLNSRLRVERGIVCQVVDDVKTSESRRDLHIDNDMLDTLKLWKQTTQFSGSDDWMFASPVQLGRLPWSYDQVWRMYQKAGAKAGIGRLGTHSLRHTYRSWLDAVGTPLQGVQRNVAHGPDSGQRKQKHSGEDQEAIVGAPLYDSGDHDYICRHAVWAECPQCDQWRQEEAR